METSLKSIRVASLMRSAEVREKITDLKFKGRGDPQKCPYAANPEPQAQNLELQAPNFESQSQNLSPNESRRDQTTARSIVRKIAPKCSLFEAFPR